jgi:hypothetical protein
MEFVADLLYDLPKDYPLVFDIIHYVVCLQAERLDMGDKFAETTQNNPLVRNFYLTIFFLFCQKLKITCQIARAGQGQA